MAKYRKDTKGRILRKGETYLKSKKLYRYTYSDVFGKRKSVYSSTLEDLREKIKRIEKDKLDGLNMTEVGKLTVNNVFDRYFAQKNEIKPSTRYTYIKYYEWYIRDGFGKRKISDIKYLDILSLYNGLQNMGMSLSSIHLVHCLLSPTFQMAVRDDVIRSNPTYGTYVEFSKKSTATRSKRHPLSKEQQRAFLSILDEPQFARYKPLYTVMFGTGCRLGEISGLRWQDIDFDNRVININHNIIFVPSGDGIKMSRIMATPKTKSGYRTIPMLDKVYDALIEERNYQEANGLKCKEMINGSSDFVFFNKMGNIWQSHRLNYNIKFLVRWYNERESERAKAEQREPLLLPVFSCHIIRHTFCTRLCESETNFKVIQTVMGHSNVQVTLDVYTEVSESKKQMCFQTLNADGVFWMTIITVTQYSDITLLSHIFQKNNTE